MTICIHVVRVDRIRVRIVRVRVRVVRVRNVMLSCFMVDNLPL